MPDDQGAKYYSDCRIICFNQMNAIMSENPLRIPEYWLLKA